MVGLTPAHGGIVPFDAEPVLTLLFIAAGLAAGIPALRRLTPPGTLTARPVLPAAVLLRGVMTFTFFGVDAYATLTLESWRGLSAVAAGVVLTAATISWTAGSWIQARGAGRWSSAQFVRAGLVVTVIGLLSFSLILSPNVPIALAVPTFAIAGLGMGLGYAPLSLIVLRESPPETQGAASSALSLSDTLGTALGTGVSGAIVAASIRATGQPVDGLVWAFTVAILVGIGGVLLTTRLRRRSAIATAVAATSPASPA
jgi:MFS family permease